MTKHDFLNELLRSLSALPLAERDKAYAFYAEIIDDSMEDGLSEEEAVERLGSMGDIVERIVSETPITVLLKSRMGWQNNRPFTITLLVLGFPVWFLVLMAVVSVLFTAFIVFWIAALVLWTLFVSGAGTALGGVVAFCYFPEAGLKLIFLGSALAGAGCAVPLYMASLAVTKLFARITVRLWKKMKNNLLKKRGILR